MPPAAPSIDAKVAYLRGLCSRADEAIETHFAWVFLVGDRAYKLRKPVARDTMDYRTPDARRIGSLEEVRLNRRLAPRVYLEAAPLTQDEQGRFSIGGHAAIVDWLVVMRRLDRGRLLDARLVEASFDEAELEPVAGLLADFYRDAPPALTDGAEFVARLRRQVRNNHAILAAARRPGVDRLFDLQLGAIERQRTAFERRATLGCIVEAHGDLRPEHVFLDDPPAVIDCLEFDRDLRLLDRAEELSFLELECQRLGHARAGRLLTAATLDRLGDPAGEGLLAFYRSHRAATRAKLLAWRAQEPDGGTPAAWLERADGYVAGARRDLETSLG